jgi:hypothetical protein
MSAFGNILGIRMTLLLGLGPVVSPAPLNAMESIEELEVRQSMIGDSGFKLSMRAGRNGPLGLLGPPFVDDPRFQRGARIVVTMWNGIKPTPIFDGIITKTQYLPGSGENEGRYIMLGRDLTWLMRREQKRVQHPAQDETIIANVITAAYAANGDRSTDPGGPGAAADLFGLELSQCDGRAAWLQGLPRSRSGARCQPALLRSRTASRHAAETDLGKPWPYVGRL